MLPPRVWLKRRRLDPTPRVLWALRPSWRSLRRDIKTDVINSWLLPGNACLLGFRFHLKWTWDCHGGFEARQKEFRSCMWHPGVLLREVKSWTHGGCATLRLNMWSWKTPAAHKVRGIPVWVPTNWTLCAEMTSASLPRAPQDPGKLLFLTPDLNLFSPLSWY